MGAADSHDQLIGERQSAEPPPVVGQNERRMHVRAYNFWVSLLAGRPFPLIADFDPSSLADFGANSVLVDFREAAEGRIAWLGRALREEGGIEGSLRCLSDVPAGALLARIGEHYPKIFANRAPVGFEADFTNAPGRTLMYRGILLPFSSDGRTVDHAYGVVNWKEVADEALTASIVADAHRALAAVRLQSTPAPAWADGPSRSLLPTGDVIGADQPADEAVALEGDLTVARAAADSARAATRRAREARNRALAQAYAFACTADEAPDAYEGLLAADRVRRDPRSPMLPLVKLVFGADHDRRCLADYAAVLAHAWRIGMPAEAMPEFLGESVDHVPDILAAERLARRAERSEEAAC